MLLFLWQGRFSGNTISYFQGNPELLRGETSAATFNSISQTDPLQTAVHIIRIQDKDIRLG